MQLEITKGKNLQVAKESLCQERQQKEQKIKENTVSAWRKQSKSIDYKERERETEREKKKA